MDTAILLHFQKDKVPLSHSFLFTQLL